MAPAENPVLAAAQDEVRLDMTPMIDCVFLMIIFFVCVDFRVLEAKLPVRLPRDRSSATLALEPREQLPVRIVAVQAGRRVYERGGPDQLDPATQRPYRYRLVDHQVRWEVGPRRVATRAQLLAELQAVHADQTTWIPDPDHPGARRPLPLVIEPLPGTCSDDVAATTDAARAAGFTDIGFGGGRAAAGSGR